MWVRVLLTVSGSSPRGSSDFWRRSLDRFLPPVLASSSWAGALRVISRNDTPRASTCPAHKISGRRAGARVFSWSRGSQVRVLSPVLAAGVAQSVEHPHTKLTHNLVRRLRFGETREIGRRDFTGAVQKSEHRGRSQPCAGGASGLDLIMDEHSLSSLDCSPRPP